MNLEEEKKYIRSFIENMTEDEFKNVMKECGSETILPTEEIFSQLQESRFYSDNILGEN